MEGRVKPNSKARKILFFYLCQKCGTNLSYVYPSNKFFWSISQGFVWSFISKYLWTNIIIRCMFTNRSNNKFASSIGQNLVRLFMTNNSYTYTIVQYIFINRSSLLVLHSQGGKCSSTCCSLSCHHVVRHFGHVSLKLEVVKTKNT